MTVEEEIAPALWLEDLKDRRKTKEERKDRKIN